MTAPTPNDARSKPATRGSASKRVTTSTGTLTKNAVQAVSPSEEQRRPEPQQRLAREEADAAARADVLVRRRARLGSRDEREDSAAETR